MMLPLLILVLLLGGLLVWAAGRISASATRWTALTVLLLDAALVGWIFCAINDSPADGRWLMTYEVDWITALNVQLYLAVDGFSLALILLTIFLGIVAVLASWKGITERVGFFYFNLLWVLAGTLGVFMALDLLAFFFFWELMVVPMVFLIAIWGHENRRYAAIKFFIFTQASSLLMLVSIVGLYALHGTFRYDDLLGTEMPEGTAFWLMLGFFVAFTVKLPAFPFHTWLADAHTEAPTAGSVILAGLMLKTGAYGLVRIVVPLFPDAARDFAPIALAMGVIGILYGALLALAQTDLKRLIAYTSVSHMGFVLVGVFSWNSWAVQGVLMQMICHGISTGALFIIAGALQDRMHTRDIRRMGGLWGVTPKLAAFGLVFALASLGLPGMGNFIGEFLILLGSFQISPTIAIIAALSLPASAIYSLRIVQRTFHGQQAERWSVTDFDRREIGVMAVLVIAILWLGLMPQPVLDLVSPSLTETLERTQQNGGAQ
ncbi:complex I subunit 4 family protein [Rubritalea profundi]|uniref:NADH dehydrogenase n=1 Tax=Rubritalea profundi TaxID=1658618 RepID=A0A2S7U082_9BACT|nr:NADH-quinone oxidoreductase subunit M [Rubritalea profundi]PQJ28409.1 NADH dehydrogenase [Rubritalea profundi]